MENTTLHERCTPFLNLTSKCSTGVVRRGSSRGLSLSLQERRDHIVKQEARSCCLGDRRRDVVLSPSYSFAWPLAGAAILNRLRSMRLRRPKKAPGSKLPAAPSTCDHGNRPPERCNRSRPIPLAKAPAYRAAARWAPLRCATHLRSAAFPKPRPRSRRQSPRACKPQGSPLRAPPDFARPWPAQAPQRHDNRAPPHPAPRSRAARHAP